MIVRPFTFLTGLVFAFSGAYLFVVKHQSQGLEDRLGQLAQTSRADEQAIRVLKAQWALEADPSRIAALAADFTQLKPMQPNQLVTLASLASSLPAPGSPPPYSNPEDMVPDMPQGAGGTPTPAGPAIQVSGSKVADAASASTAASAATSPAPQQQVADNQVPATALPVPPPAAPALPPVASALPSGVSSWHSSVHLASDQHASRSWIAPIPRQPHDVHKARIEPSVSPSYVIQTRAEAVVPAPSQPLGAQVVRIKAVGRQPVAVVHHDADTGLPPDGGSLLGMAQSGSQN